MEMDEESLPVFWEIWIRRKSDSIFVRFENLSVLDTIWVSIKCIRVWIFRRNLLKFEIFRFFKIEIIIMDRSIYIIVSNINVFESYTFWGFI